MYAAEGTKYTDYIKDFWHIHWSDVDRTGVVDHASTHPEKYSPGYDTLANFTNEIVQRFLPDWLWWVGHDGSDVNGIIKKLFVQPRGHTDLTGSVTITEDDVGVPFRVQPQVDPRNAITVVGDADPTVNPNWPVSVTSTDTTSQTAYRERDLVTKESEVVDQGALGIVGASLLEQRRFDLWQGRFEIYNWTIEPGEKVSVYLPTIGVNNGSNGVPWVLMEVEEQVSRGSARRWGTFAEHNDAALFRVT